MADINVERKGPSIWPWIIGLLVLALLIWAIAEMVDTDEEEVAVVEPTEEVEAPGVQAPAAEPEFGEAPMRGLQGVIPLNPDDIGERVQTTGTVIGSATPTGFFIRTPPNNVIFVESTEQVQPGAQVQVMGEIQSRPETELVREWEEAGFAEEDWEDEVFEEEDYDLLELDEPFEEPGYEATVQREYYLDATQVQMQPGMQQPAQPGDTVQGRY